MRTWPINSWKRRADTDTALKERESQLDGLSQAKAASRLNQYGPNEIAREKRQSPLMRLLDNVKNPLVILLTALGVLSYLTGDLRAMVVIFVMVLLGLCDPDPGGQDLVHPQVWRVIGMDRNIRF